MPALLSRIHYLVSSLKKLPPTASYLLLATILSGCTAIGQNKPAALQVTSVPEASIFLDGKHLGKTPFFSDQLKEGEYTLKIAVSQASFVEKITLAAGTLTVVNRELNNNFLAQSGETLFLSPGKKGLLVVSIPSGATLSIDGRLIGETPLFSQDIAEGEHKILLSKSGFVDREFAIKISSNNLLNAQVTLASEIAKGLKSASSPSPAPIAKVAVTQTPQGFLRVRSQPSLEASEIGRIQTDDQLEVVQETPDWIQVKFEGKVGWVWGQYVRKLP